VSVTATTRSDWSDKSRNKTIEAEAVTAGREWGERWERSHAFHKSREDAEVAGAASRLRTSAFRCDQCKREFDVGQTIYLRRFNGQFGAPFGFVPYCLTCICSWHPSWMKAARKPVPCGGGCGVYVTSPYPDVCFWKKLNTYSLGEDWKPYARYCSRRCRERAEKIRRSPRVERVCLVCEEEFVPKRADARYCSNACRQDAYRKRKLGAA
jgi:hypothetical protein